MWTLDNPPPTEPPKWLVNGKGLWRWGARRWRDHTPDLMTNKCRSCSRSSPCPDRRAANEVLAGLVVTHR